jgi:SAM-dependent methyltransferase
MPTRVKRPPRRRLTTYDAIALSYDHEAHVEPVQGFFEEIRPIVSQLEDDAVLDLGCGTGLLTERLAASGCFVLGVDASARMLDVARMRCRKFGRSVRFVHLDFARLGTLQKSYSAAFASGDVVNHLMSTRELSHFFAHVRTRLRPRSVFCFDVLNRWCFENYWQDQTYLFESIQGDMVMDCTWDAREMVGSARTVVYRKLTSGAYERRSTTISERFFPMPVIRKLLKRAGFRTVRALSWSPWMDQDQEQRNDRTLWMAWA